MLKQRPRGDGGHVGGGFVFVTIILDWVGPEEITEKAMRAWFLEAVELRQKRLGWHQYDFKMDG